MVELAVAVDTIACPRDEGLLLLEGCTLTFGGGGVELSLIALVLLLNLIGALGWLRPLWLLWSVEVGLQMFLDAGLDVGWVFNDLLRDCPFCCSEYLSR